MNAAEMQRLRHLSAHARAALEAETRPLQPLSGAITGVSLPEGGDYPCVRRCGARVTLPGVCAGCVQKDERAARRAALFRARSSVPEFWRWARVGSAELTDRLLGGATLRRQRADMARVAPQSTALADIEREIRKTEKKVPSYIERARKVLDEHRLLVLWGDSGVGKTSVAVALLQEIIDAGEQAIEATAVEGGMYRVRCPDGPRDVDAAALRAMRATDTKTHDRARLARFLDAGSIHKLENIHATIGDKPDVEDLDFFEKRARVLVIDNLGFELNGCPPNTPLAAMRIEATSTLVSTRIAKKRDTIITMWMPREEVSRVYGGGFSRLLFEMGWAVELPRTQTPGVARP